MENIKALNIAQWFINQEEMSPKKVQKLVYYAYCWYLVYFNETEEELTNRLFSDNLEAWIHGPVVAEIYHEYKEYGYRPIYEKYQNVHFEEDTEEVLEEVWERYRHLSADELERLTHKELPWKEARTGLGPLDATDRKIDDKIIFKYYGSQLV